MPTQNVNLSEHFAQFIRDCVASGHYNNASEVVRTALRLLEQQQEEHRMKLERLRSEVHTGFEDLKEGRYREINGEEELQSFFNEIDERSDALLRREATGVQATEV
ncbi:MAG: type II toxin-antitoxin system ParD family antitoxin [Candidatus Hydrogenedentes bacterium]|nr:type II toxin-antitoxin system ParD family antitoxin [Candidatus Hydrogenedentota bacterium]